MKKLRFVLAPILALACAVCSAARPASRSLVGSSPQSSSPPAASADSTSIPVGFEIVGTLTTKLDTKHAKVGDPVEVEVTQNVLEGDQVVLAKGSRVIGHVTDVSAFSRKVTNARLEVVFDGISSKDGGQISTYLSVYALAARHDEASENIADPRGMNATATTAGVAGGLGHPAGAQLRPGSRGVFNMDGVSLFPMARDNPPTSLVRSESRDIHVDKGTEILLVVAGNSFSSGRPSK